MSTVFEKIIAREVPAEIIYEDDQAIVIKDRAPKAPIHLLIISKKPIPNLQSLQPEDGSLVAHLIALAPRLAQQFGLLPLGYRLIINNGGGAGQTVFHLHLHLLGGEPLGEMC